MFSFHVKRAVKIKLFHVKHRLFLRFSPLYIPLLFRFYLFYIHIILLRYVDFSRYLFVVFMGIFALNHVLFYGVLPCIFIASFEHISPCLAQNQVRFIGLCHPATEFFALKSVFYCGSLFSNMATKEICWLVGWLVGQFGLFGSDSFGQIVACRSFIIMPVFDKMLSSGSFSSGFTSVCNIVKTCVFRRFLKNFIFAVFATV